MWHYRIHERKDHLGNKYYCVVEFYPKKSSKYLDGSTSKDLWSAEPESPFGDTPEELIKCLEMMLKDCKKYKILRRV